MSQQPPPGPDQGPPGYPYPYAYAAPPPNHPQAVTALVLGILSLVLCGFFTGIPAMVLGRRVRRDVRASGGTVGGEGLGVAGFWTGLIGTVLSCGSTLLVVAVFALGGVTSSHFHTTCHVVTPNGHSRPC